jgi:ABC-2 type transport system ATP-binding protein
MQRAHEVLYYVGLGEARYRNVETYSTGMKQRIKLAQSLAHDPKLLLLDEPTNGLDPEGREEMLALVQRTGREFGIAVVVTSHLLGEIERVCDSLLAIDAGKLQYAGPVAAFTERSRLLLVELDDEMPELVQQLRSRGLSVDGEGSRFVVTLTSDDVFDTVRDVAAELSAPVSRLEVARHRLEELFRRPVAEVTHV